MNLNLEGKVAIVTGAGSGIDREIALDFVKAGAKVAILGRTVEKLNSVLADMGAARNSGLTIRCDVANRQEVVAAVQETARALGGVDTIMVDGGRFIDAGR